MKRELVEMRAHPWVREVTEDAILVEGVLDSFNLWVPKHDKSVTPSILYNGFWESWITTWCYNNIESGWEILDIGANCGYYTMLFERLTGAFGQVYAYEANPFYTDLLEKTKEENSANFDIHNIALSDFPDEVELHIPGELMGSASIVTDWKNDDRYEDTFITAPGSTLDIESGIGNFWEPDFIKMDVEGAEELVWLGGINMLEGAPIVMMEYTPGAYSNTFNDRLFEWGEVTRITEDGTEGSVDHAHLESLTDWDMLVIRKR